MTDNEDIIPEDAAAEDNHEGNPTGSHKDNHEDPHVDEQPQNTGKFAHLMHIDDANRHRITGMYQDWFLDYASYVILERAVPHLYDGLKPVQRRILHTMKRMDDGRYTKVANIIGRTMEFHPHGDASIGDALVQLGQKDLLIDTQGNWGNIPTGDSAAAPRYIEARLSAFAHDIAFNPKITDYTPNYDGRLQEPVALPVKFPLLLAQGVEGIAVGLASKILPHNFCELIDAAINILHDKDFEIYPDFLTGGRADVSRYNDGLRGGAVKVRSDISIKDNKTLVISSVPYGKTTTMVIDSILKANDKGKIKVRKVDDNTAQNVEIVVHLSGDASPDKTIDALYAFTDCEVSISPNACVIVDNKPAFMGVKDILRYNVNRTRTLLQRELQLRIDELDADWHYSSLEKIFFEKRIYKVLENDAPTWEQQLQTITAELSKYRALLRRDITSEDAAKLCEKPVRKISKFDIKAADERIAGIEKEEAQTRNNMDNLTDYTAAFFRSIKKKYGKGKERLTRLENFDTIEAAQVAAVNAKLYVSRKDGFVGTDLRRDEQAEYVCDCSDIDDIIVFMKNGKFVVCKVAEKAFIGKDIVYAGVFKRGDTRTIYNVVYRDGRGGAAMYKRFAVGGITRGKEYDLTKGTLGSEVLYLSANRNGEAEKLRVLLMPRPHLKNLALELDFSQIEIKGRASQGNIFTRYQIHGVQLKERGASTIGGQKIWFDHDNKRLNVDERGEYLGDFYEGDMLLAISSRGTMRTTSFELVNKYAQDTIYIKRFDAKRVLSAVYFDAEQKYFYLKRFVPEASSSPQNIVDDNADDKKKKSYLVAISDDQYPQVEVEFASARRLQGVVISKELVDVEQFIGVKSFRAKGKRLSTYELRRVRFVEPLQKEAIFAPTPPDEPAEAQGDELF
jgi:topoisomerase-4 subunit A